MTRKSIFVLFVVLLFIVPTMATWAQYKFFVQIEGMKQGMFKGEALQARWQGTIPCYKFQHEVTSPRDIATGLPSGKRQHGPIMVLKKLGAASPQIMQALCTNETLKTVLISFIGTSADGTEEVYYTIKLSNATISAVKQETISQDLSVASASKAAAINIAGEYQWVSITYQRIEWESKTGKTMAMDDWHL